MTITRTLGGDRLGSGKKMQVEMKSYERSTHDLSYIWRSTMAAGTLVPFMSELGLPGDTFDINLDCNVMTHPTVGPLFGSYKVQLDVFMAPIRLYQGMLHNNKLGIGLDMAQIKLPQVKVTVDKTQVGELELLDSIDNIQINPSSILSYLNIRGIGIAEGTAGDQESRKFNGCSFLTYWDVYKNYYANKAEGIGAVIHNGTIASPQTITEVQIGDNTQMYPDLVQAPATVAIEPDIHNGAFARLVFVGAAPDPEQIIINTDLGTFKFTELFAVVTNETATQIVGTGAVSGGVWINWNYASVDDLVTEEPQVYTFPLSDLDDMREDILHAVTTPTAFVIDENSPEPYNLVLSWTGTGTNRRYSKMSTQEGLALKTYQSDLFNNWIETDWIDGTNGINEITSVDTTGGSFSIDQLNLSKKVYDMLNRIAISGGSYKDWIDTVWTAKGNWRPETPMYMGGLIKELVFQEVVSNAESGGDGGEQPLGTLAGKGVMSKKHKGGNITVKVEEPCYVMGIISLTPRIDYSQGNKWDVNLKTMDDFHKPALDEIGFQDLITDQMAWWDTKIIAAVPTFYSAGKQPAWMNYMTNVNQVRGNFAIEGNEMFMTLNRKYAHDAGNRIDDLTTYIDPVKFNDIFAQTSRDAQNFWTQISVDITARRMMSAKIIPNL